MSERDKDADGLSARELDLLVRRELRENAPRAPAAPPRERVLKPEVQRDLDALLQAIEASLGSGTGLD